MNDIEDELRAATEKLRAADERRSDQSAYRDDVIRRALDSGVSWARVREITGLSMRGLQLSARRTVDASRKARKPRS